MNKHRNTQKPSAQNPNTRDGLQSAAVRTDSLPNGTPSPAPPAISTEYDVLSHALHHNGYWPERSLIILTAHNSVLGPSLRVNLPEEPLPESHRAVYLTGLFTMIPAEYDGAPLNRFYAIIVDGDNAVRQRQLDPATRTAATLHEVGADITAQSRISSWAHMLFDPRIVGERRCEDIIYAGAATVWALNDRMEALTLLGPIEDLHTSRYQVWRTSLGDSIAPDATGNFARSPWDTDTTNNPATRDDWESASELWSATRAQRVPVTTTDRAYRQAQLDLCYWETAISAVEPYLNTPPELSERTIGDTLRELIPAEVAGYLRASLQPSTLTNAFEEHSTLEILSPETLAYLAGYGLDRTQQVLTIQRYTTDYIYYALGGAAPLGEPREEPIEPPHYGTRITRKARIPRSFTAALAGEGPAVRTVPAKCNQWQDWIRRTHRTIQAADLERWAFTELDGIDLAESSLLHEETLHEYRGGRVSPYAAETDGEAPATDEENRDQHIIQQLNNSTSRPSTTTAPRSPGLPMSRHPTTAVSTPSSFSPAFSFRAPTLRSTAPYAPFNPGATGSRDTAPTPTCCATKHSSTTSASAPTSSMRDSPPEPAPPGSPLGVQIPTRLPKGPPSAPSSPAKTPRPTASQVESPRKSAILMY